MTMDFDVLGLVDRLKTKAQPADAIAKFEAEQAAKEATRIADVLDGWGVPKRIRLTLAQPQTTKAIETVADWIAAGERAWCLILSADKGLGKSTAAGWWLAQVAKAAEVAPSPFRRWWPAAEIAALDFYGEDYKRLCECASLVIDDLGVEYSDQKGAFQAKLDRLLDARYREFRRTLITTNLAGKDFAERYGGRILDRMREGAVWAGIKGQSMRGAA
jgi:hypothetical protein